MIRVVISGRDTAEAYRAAVARVARLEVIAVVEPEPWDAGPEYACATRHATWDSLLIDARDSFDAVVLGPGEPSVTALVARLATAGKHILTETPLGANLAEVDRCRSAEELSGILVMASQPLRHLPAIREIKSAVTDERLGQPGLLRVHRWLPTGSELPDVPALRILHEVDLALWIFGSLPTHVYAVGPSGEFSLGECSLGGGFTQVHLGFVGGGMALIDFAFRLPRGAGYFSASLIGSSGAAHADDHHNMQLVFRGGAPAAVPTPSEGVWRRAQLDEFTHAVLARATPSCSSMAFRNALLVADAISLALSQRRACLLRGETYELA